MTATQARALRKCFYLMLTPALSGFMLIWLMPISGATAPPGLATVSAWPAALFVLSIITAAAAPILIRTGFAHRVRSQSASAMDAFLRFQRTLLVTVMLTPYLTLIAYALDAPRFYMTGSLLAMLYALYYHYPSDRRLDFDRRIFRVR